MTLSSFLRIAQRKKISKKECRKCLLRKNGECRCRQGRNYESRQRGLSSKNLYAEGLVRSFRCDGCEATTFDVDYKTADIICTECGMVLDSMGLAELFDTRVTFSKKYSTRVYWREKLRGFHGTDPIIWKEDWRLIKRCIPFFLDQDQRRRMGQATFSRLCRTLTDSEGKHPLANKKYGERYIQARFRLGLEVPAPMSQHLLFMTLIRIEVYEKAHREAFQYKITKKNAINLNYVLLQFILMDSPQEFDSWKRWIKISLGKLDSYNEKWKQMILELATNYDVYLYNEKYYKLPWTFTRLSISDLYVPKELEII